MVDPLAIYGAAIGSVAAIGTAWNIYHSAFRDRARLRLSLATGITQDVPSVRSNEWLWMIEAQNFGRRPLTISGHGGLELANGRWVVFTGVFEQLPRRLGENQKVTFWIYEVSLQKALREQGLLPTRIRLTDDGGSTHKRRIPAKYRRQLASLKQREVKTE